MPRTKEQELELLDLRERELMLMKKKRDMAPAPSRGELSQPQPAKDEPELTDRDLNMATQGLKVRPKVLADTRRLVPFFGGSVKGEEAPLSQRVLGFLGDSLAFGLPQKAFIESQAAEPRGIAKYYKSWKEMTEPEGAVDDLTEDEIKYVDRVRQMAVAKKGWGQWIAEAGAGLLVPGGLAAKAGKGAGLSTKLALGTVEGAAVGGTAGVGYSPHGKELEGGLAGAGLGAGLGLAVPGVIHSLQALRKGGENAIVNHALRSAERLDVEEALEKELSKTKHQDTLNMFKSLAVDKKGLFKPTKITELPADAKKLSAVPLRNMRVAKALDGEELDAALQRMQFEGDIKFQSLAKQYLNFHGVKNATQLNEKVIRQGGKEALSDSIEQWYRTKVGEKLVMKQMNKKSPKVVGPLHKMFTLLSDGKPVQMWIDNKLGTRLSPAIDTMSRKSVVVSHIADASLEKLDALKAAGKVPTSLKELESGQFSKMPEELRGFYSDLRKLLNSKELGLDIEDAGINYVPNQFKSNKQIILDVTTAVKQFGKGNLDAAEVKDLTHSLSLLTGKKVKEENINKAYRKFISQPGINLAQATTTRAKGALESKDAMPLLLREDDVYKSTVAYMQNMFRHAANREGLKEIRFVRDMVRKASTANEGASLAHIDDYLSNLMADITGTRSQGNFLFKLGQESVASFEKAAILKAAKATSEGEKRFYKAAADIPDMLRAVNAFVYPNFIGLNPRSVLQNLSSPYFMNVGALGGRYGSSLAMEAALDSAKLLKGGMKSWDDLVQNMGYIEPKFRGELTDAARDAMASSSQLGKKAVDKWVDLSMYFFNKSEKLARVQNHFMATRLSQDLIKASKGAKGFRADAAKRFLDDIPDRAYRRQLSKLYNAGKEEELTDGIRQYFNAQSMFNYNRANMSEFGRVMGPVFSVFTKWPSTMYGRVFQQLSDEGKINGGGRLARMFLYPLLLATAADSVLEGMGATETTQHDLFIGKRGIKSWTPASNLASWTSGEFLMPPLVQMSIGLGDAAGDLAENPKGAAKKAERAVSGYVPFYNLGPLLFKRTPQLFGEEPEATTYTDLITD